MRLRIKKLLACCLAAALLLGCLPMAAMAAETKASMDIIGTTTADANGAYQLDFKATADSASVGNVVNIVVNFSYDSSIVTPVDADGETWKAITSTAVADIKKSFLGGAITSRSYATVMNPAVTVNGTRTTISMTFLYIDGTDATDGKVFGSFYYKPVDSAAAAKMAKGMFKLETDGTQILAVSAKNGDDVTKYVYTNDSDTDTVALASFTYPGSDKQTLGSLAIAAAGDTTSVDVPKALGDNATTTAATLALTASALDTDGDPMQTFPSDAKWTLEGNTDTENVTLTANASDPSKATLSVKPGAKANAALTVKITSGGVSATKTIAINRDTLAPTAAKIFLASKEIASEDTIVIPVGTQADAETTYTAKLYDQYGGEYETIPSGSELAWSFATATTGVSHADGVVTVTKEASAGSFTLTAKFGAVEKAVTIKTTSMVLDDNWAAVDAKMNTAITYGTANSGAAKSALGTGSATAGTTKLTGTFAIVDGTTIQAAGDQKVTVRYTVTTAGDYKDQYLEKEYDVKVNPKAITVNADAKTKTYGAAIPTLTFTVPSGALVNGDKDTALTVNLSTTATKDSNVGSYDITGTGTAANYTITVKAAKLTVTKATITGYDTAAPTLTLLANDAANTSAAALKTKMALPANVDVTYADGTASLPITWANATETYNVKGGTYTYKGTVTPGTNFNAYSTPLTATLTVKPVTGTLDTALTSPVVIAKSVAEKATAYTDFKLPASVKVNFDNGVAAVTYSDLTWSVPLNTLKAKAVNSKTDVKLTSLPSWITLDESKLTVQVQITDKFPVTVTVTQAGTTYGTALAAPSASQTAIDDGTDASATYSYRYTGTTAAGKKYDSATAPTDAGTYTVTATLVSDTHAGSGTSAEFTIAPKALTSGMIAAIDAEDYDTKAHTPEPVVTDGAALAKGTDYTVAYANNVNAGTADVTVTGTNNYTGDVTVHFTINKASISAIQPTISGTAQVGQVLTAALPGVADEEVTWQWSRGGAAISGATGRTYILTAADSNQEITVKATAKDVNYASGDSLTSEAVSVAKQSVSGSVSVTVKTNNDGDATKIGATDVITATVTGVLPSEAQSSLTYQWDRDGTPIETATAADYTVTADDVGKKLTVTVTGGGNYTGELTASIEVGKTILSGTVSVAGATSPAKIGDELTATINAGTATADDYEIVWTRDGEVISGESGTTYTLTSDDAGKTVSAKIVAKGNAYTGEVAATGVAVSAEKPDKPSLSLTAGNGTITANWTAPAANGAPITQYTLTISDGETTETVTANSDATSYTFSGLTNGTEYTVTLAAVNTEGTSDADSKTATPKASGGGYVPSSEEPADDEPVTETTTAADGTVTETTTWPDGKTAVAVTTPDGDKTITVKDADGETMAEMEIPAEPGEAKKFVDVPDNAWYEEAVNDTSAYKLFNGTSETTFSPEMPMTRGMLVTVLHNLSGNPEYGTDKHPFADVRNGAWYEDPADWAVAVGVTSGTDKGFEPNLDINREQLVTMLYNYAKLVSPDTKERAALTAFPDAGSVSNFAREAMEWAVSEGLISGRDMGSGVVLAPKGTASRAEVASIMSRFVKFLTD